jgi:hypothetical protein
MKSQSAECKQGAVCTLVSPQEGYLDLRVVNMTKKPVRLPQLHGIGAAESPASFVIDYSPADIPEPAGQNPPSLDRWGTLTLYPGEGISYALPWNQYRMIFDQDSGCRKVSVNLIINSWARQKVYYEDAIVPAELEICAPSS